MEEGRNEGRGLERYEQKVSEVKQKKENRKKERQIKEREWRKKRKPPNNGN